MKRYIRNTRTDQQLGLPSASRLLRLLFLGIFVAGTAFVPAKTIEIVRIQDLTFGTLLRNETKSVAYSAPEAGLFDLRGDSREKLTIQVAVIPPGVDDNRIDLIIRPADVAYSRDGGITWTECKSASLSWSTQFPRTTGGVKASILVRVGGKLVTTSGQSRGDYRGVVRLRAYYSD